MDAELVTLASTAASTIVTLLATDAWEKARSAVGTFWQRMHPASARAIEAELTEAQAALVADANRDEHSRQADYGGCWSATRKRPMNYGGCSMRN